jgi:hypothetical protein
MNTRKVGFAHIPITQDAHKAFDCNELTFVNTGTVNVTIANVLVLTPGQAVTYPCFHPEDLNCTIYDIVFPRPYANGQLVVAICKNYM